MGLNAGHIELANNILKAQDVSVFVFTSGIVDTCIALLLFIGVFSQQVSKIAIIWITFIVIISFMTGIPDGIFRMGFLLSAFYIAIEKKCHTKSLITILKK